MSLTPKQSEPQTTGEAVVAILGGLGSIAISIITAIIFAFSIQFFYTDIGEILGLAFPSVTVAQTYLAMVAFGIIRLWMSDPRDILKSYAEPLQSSELVKVNFMRVFAVTFLLGFYLIVRAFLG